MAHKGNINGTRKDLLLQRRWTVPTLPSAPTTSTWAWNDNGYIVSFRIGEQVRVADESQESGYQFWKLYDIKANGDRIWAPINSCAVSIHVFRVIENDCGTGQSIKGVARITITSPDDDRDLNFTWNGQDVSYYLKKNARYTCTPGAAGDYTIPGSFSFTTSNADPLKVIHEITYNFRSENVEVMVTKANDTDIEAVPVSIVSQGSVLATKSINTVSSAYTLLGDVLFNKSYYLLVGGSTFCWSGTLFSSFRTTERTASANTYRISLPFTDERIDVIIKHTTSNGEVFFDPEDVEDYKDTDIYIQTLATKNSQYEGNATNEDIVTDSKSAPYRNRITPISSDPRNTASIQYRIAKYLLPGNYVIVGSSTFRIRSATKDFLYSDFYQLQSPVTKQLTENDNIIEFQWNLIYTFLIVESSDSRTPSINVRKTSSGTSMNVSKTPENRIASFGMIPVPGDYSISFADIPYTYKGVDTFLSCSDIDISPSKRSSKKYRVSGDEYSYWHHYTYDYTFTAEGKDVTIYVTITPDEFGESLPYGTILDVDSSRLNRHMGQFQIKYTNGSGTYNEYCDMYIKDFSSDNTCTLQKTLEGRISTLPVNVIGVSMSIGVSYTIGGTQTDENGERYLRTIRATT